MTFMELTFLKLVGPHTTIRGWERGRRRRSEQEKRKSKKDRSAGASWVDGDNGSLGIALSIFSPLGPSAPPLRALRSTPFHSIPPLFHPLRLPWKLSRYHTPLLIPGKAPSSHRQTRRFPSYAQALSPLSWRMTLHSLGCICMVSSLPDYHLLGFTSVNICIAFCIMCMHFHTKWNYFDEQRGSF